MIRRPPRSTPLYSSAASDVYKRQLYARLHSSLASPSMLPAPTKAIMGMTCLLYTSPSPRTSQDLVCRLLLEKKKKKNAVFYSIQSSKINHRNKLLYSIDNNEIALSKPIDNKLI